MVVCEVRTANDFHVVCSFSIPLRSIYLLAPLSSSHRIEDIGARSANLVNMVAVLFDFDHTLGFDHQLEERVLADLGFRWTGGPVPDQDVRRVLLAFREDHKPIREAVSEALEKWGLTSKEIAEAFDEFVRDCLTRVPESVKPAEHSQELLKALTEKKIPFGVFTNGWKALQEAKARQIGYLCHVVTSEELGLWKPDPEAFKEAIRWFRFEKDRVAYVGDSPETDIVGAKKAGLVAIWVNFENKPYPEELPESPDYQVTSLLEIVSIVSKL